MRNFLLIAAVVMLPASMAAAEPANTPKLPKTTPPDKLLPLKNASTGNGCAAYGTGFAKVDGSDTCVKIGGSARVDVGAQH